MRDVFLTKTAELTVDHGQIQLQPIPIDKQVTTQLVTQPDDEVMPDWGLEQQEAGLYSIEIRDRASNGIINLSFATASTKHGMVETFAFDDAEAQAHLTTQLLLSEAGGSGAELATGNADITPRAEQKIHDFLQHNAA